MVAGSRSKCIAKNEEKYKRKKCMRREKNGIRGLVVVMY